MNILKLSDFKKKLPFHINYGVADIGVRDLIEVRDNYSYEFDFDVFLPSKGKNLQRPLVWTLLQKQQLIISMLKGIYIASISVINYDHKIYKVIDGKQRLNAIIDFCLGKFPLVYNDQEFYFNNLEKDAQMEIKLYRLISNIGYEYPDKLISDDDKITWFEIINFAGTPQDIEHLNNLKK